MLHISRIILSSQAGGGPSGKQLVLRLDLKAGPAVGGKQLGRDWAPLSASARPWSGGGLDVHRLGAAGGSQVCGPEKR